MADVYAHIGACGRAPRGHPNTTLQSLWMNDGERFILLLLLLPHRLRIGSTSVFFFYFYFPFSSTFSPLLLLGLYGIANGVYITCVCVWMAFRDACRHPHGRNRYLIEFSSIYFRAHNIPSIDILYCGVYNIRSDEAHIICVFQQTEDGEKELYSTSTSQCCCVEAHYITESINLLISFNLFLFRSDRRFVCSCSIWK